MLSKIWKPQTVAVDEQQLQMIVDTMGLHPIIARMLAARGLVTAEEIQHFLHDNVENLADPFLMKGVKESVERIVRAIQAGERIVIYGDYDVDGMTSTSVLKHCLERLGARPAYYIPDRLEEGYGINEAALRHLVDEGYGLVITVDCGITAVDLVREFAKKIDIIVTDHHQPGAQVPAALAVLNPKQAGCAYPDKNLAGVGVAYTLCRALWQHYHRRDYVADVELVALGTVADVVPLLAENRIYVRAGLDAFAKTTNVGLLALLKVCGVDPEAVTAERIGFSLAPRLNAAGRLAHAREGVALLTEVDPASAAERAQWLFDINAERQGTERLIYQAAIKRMEDLRNKDKGVLVLDGEDWHSGVIGIVASRLVETYYRPVIMISVVDGVGKGSCRSIPNLNMYEALQSCADVLLQFGGHHQAAGFSVEASKIPELRERLEQYAQTHLSSNDFVPVLPIERELSITDANVELVEMMERLEPYGEANPAPIFAIHGLQVESCFRIGANRNHVKGVCRGDGEKLEVIGWGLGELSGEVFAGDRIDVACALQVNEWQGVRRIQALIRDIRIVESTPLIVTRDMLVPIYKAIRTFLKMGEKTPVEIEQEFASSNIPKQLLYTALKIFRELGILDLRQDEEGVSYRLGQVDGKMDLSTSVTYLRYSGKGEMV